MGDNAKKYICDSLKLNNLLLDNTESDSFEQINIYDTTQFQTQSTYNQIAQQFSQTRYKMWPGVKQFLLSLPESYNILDAGCGNGKNMLETQHNFYGIDLSDELLKEAKRKTINKTNIMGFEQLSITNMNTIKSNTFDAVMSIAVIHHLETQNERINAIKEMIRVCKNGSAILLTVWKLEDNDVYEKGKSITTDTHNKLIMWKDVKNNISYDRFYHFFSHEEIIELIKLINEELISDSTCEKSKYIKDCKITEEANNYYIKMYLS